MAHRPPIRPEVWTPPRRSGRARAWKHQRSLPPVDLIPLSGLGPEDVVVDVQGRVLCGVADGRLLRLSPDGREAVTLADIAPGRPAGLEALPDGRVLVCDARGGRLLRVDPDKGTVETLADRIGGVPLKLVSNVVCAADGTVYFTESSRRFVIDNWRGDLLEHSGTGRLLRLRASGGKGHGKGHGEPEVLLDGLQFANGLAFGPDESYLAVAETGAYRVSRYWLTGERAGTRDTLIDLPGFPDNLGAGTHGLLWIAMVAPRDPLLDTLHRMHPAARQALWRVPDALLPGPKSTVWVMAVDTSGRVVHDLQGPTPAFRAVTGVAEHDGRLYLGSLTEPSIATLDLAHVRL
ncbi:SMP-30/gluconolactonase/LRE family protein [Streptacidiphilus sp. MAP5-3]|uniref:SMP-30/gluconolactonase/LRE family protein n=1 Tax=unclassified Streptacidiphilus TaxID=2643834 RepID=UPI0035115CEB